MGTDDAVRLTARTPLGAHAPEPHLAAWLARHAAALDTDAAHALELVPRLAAAGAFRAGVPAAEGGAGGDLGDAIGWIASLAWHSATAAFVCWGQRTFIEYLLQSPNAALRARCLPALLDGTLAGATGLSNAMKYLQGVEALQIDAQPDPAQPSHWRLAGRLPWVSNLRPDNFVVAAAVARGERAAVVALPHDAPGLARSADLDLIALRGSHTAALAFDAVPLDPAWVIHDDAQAFLPAARPAFLGLQCGLSIGLARRALDEARAATDSSRDVLGDELDAAERTLDDAAGQLVEGVLDGRFRAEPARLFALRIALAGCVQDALELELQASGGRAYVRRDGASNGFERRWREGAFVPVVTPSLVQLKAQLAAQARSAAA